MTRFDDTFATVAAPEMLDEFGEPIFFYAAQDPDNVRLITAIVNFAAVDSLAQETDTNIQTVLVDVLQDAADPTYGGISTPRDKDKFLRAGETPDDDGYFAWTGEIVSANGGMLCLKFTRPNIFRVGKR